MTTIEDIFNTDFTSKSCDESRCGGLNSKMMQKALCHTSKKYRDGAKLNLKTGSDDSTITDDPNPDDDDPALFKKATTKGEGAAMTFDQCVKDKKDAQHAIFTNDLRFYNLLNCDDDDKL